MKKLIALIVLAACFTVGVFAQSNDTESKTPIWDHGDNVSTISYENVPIYQIWDQKEAYIVFYQKQDLSAGRVALPKKWVKPSESKLFFRNKPKGMDPYMSIYYKDGSFYKVIITVPSNRADHVWAVAPHNYKISGTDADTLEFQY